VRAFFRGIRAIDAASAHAERYIAERLESNFFDIAGNTVGVVILPASPRLPTPADRPATQPSRHKPSA
jgi:hypothetical protein